MRINCTVVYACALTSLPVWNRRRSSASAEPFANFIDEVVELSAFAAEHGKMSRIDVSALPGYSGAVGQSLDAVRWMENGSGSIGGAELAVTRTPKHCLGVYAEVRQPGEIAVASVISRISNFFARPPAC